MRILITAITFVVTWSSISTDASRPFSSQNLAFRKSIASPRRPLDDLLTLRGGASKNKRKKKKSGGSSASLSSLNKSKKRTATGSKVVGKDVEEPTAVQEQLRKYRSILPLTRIYISCVAFTTLLGAVLGDEVTHGVLGLDPIRLVYGLEIWRPFTAASFLGTPSISLLMSGYYLFEYGSNLERVYGTAQHCIFLAVQIVMLAAASMLFGLPFFGASVITSMLHVMSRAVPHQKVKWLIFTVPYWTLPYGLMLSDVLQVMQQGQGGGMAAALPHVLGILTGHFYYYHKFIWPKMGGEDWLAAPDFLVRRLDPDSADDSAARKQMESVLKNRKKGKGRKLNA